jgi:hypothetical protein
VVVRVADFARVEAHHKPVGLKFRRNLDGDRLGALDGRCPLARGKLSFWNRAEKFLDFRRCLIGVEPADHHQPGVVGVIPLVVVGLDGLSGGGFNMRLLADDRMPIGRLCAEQERQDRLIFKVVRLVFVAVEFQDDGALLLFKFVFFINAQVAHSVGFDLEGDGPAVGGEVEVEVREILGRVGVVLSAGAAGELVDVAGH